MILLQFGWYSQTMNIVVKTCVQLLSSGCIVYLYLPNIVQILSEILHCYLNVEFFQVMSSLCCSYSML